MINNWAGHIKEIAIKWEPVLGKGNKNIPLHISLQGGDPRALWRYPAHWVLFTMKHGQPQEKLWRSQPESA